MVGSFFVGSQTGEAITPSQYKKQKQQTMNTPTQPCKDYAPDTLAVDPKDRLICTSCFHHREDHSTDTHTEEINFNHFQFPKLAQAVVEQMGGKESFLQSWEDIINHGISGGFYGFIYYSDTTDFAKRNIRLIREMARQQADDFGMGMLEMIQGFNCLGKDFSLDEIGEALFGGGDDDQILNALAWYAAEEVCHQYSVSKED
jgi:hypothetical protein